MKSIKFSALYNLLAESINQSVSLFLGKFECPSEKNRFLWYCCYLSIFSSFFMSEAQVLMTVLDFFFLGIISRKGTSFLSVCVCVGGGAPGAPGGISFDVGFFKKHGLGASPHTEKPWILLPNCLYSLDIFQYVYCGCFWTRLWRHKFRN